MEISSSSSGFHAWASARAMMVVLALLETDGLVYDGFHDCITFRVRGNLPQDREKMLRKLEAAIGEYEAKEPVFAFVP